MSFENINEIILDVASYPSVVIKQVTLTNNQVWELQGNCIRCGACCLKMNNKCKDHYIENVNDKKISSCRNIWDRLFKCSIFPRNPLDNLEESCGYRWERIS